jgi:Zn-dependent protease
MLNELVLIVFYVIILLYSVIIHEVSHGFAALALGDSTAKYAGRLTFNPLRHIDPIWTILVPLLMLFTVGFAFGAAKPVPYNPYNLRNQRWGPALVAGAGPGINIILALIFAIFGSLISIPLKLKEDIVANVMRLNWDGLAVAISGSVGSIFFAIFSIIIFWNVLLAFFNLIPIPPLDGSKLLFSVLHIKTETMILLEQFGFILLILFIFLFSGILSIILNFFWNLFFAIAI